MSSNPEKKRKRDAGPNDEPSRPRKSRILDTEKSDTKHSTKHQDNSISNGISNDANIDSTKKKSGLSRQEKSERRSKKPKKDEERRKSRKSIGDLDNTLEYKQSDTAPEKKNVEKPDLENLDPGQKAASSKPSKSKKPKSEVETDEQPKTASRFIVFVGNLPYDVTKLQIESHFAKIAPMSVRLNTNKVTGRGKGFAFLEFDAYDKMKTCLALYHHSIFNPEATAKGLDPTETTTENGTSKKGRKINVELTAGGGGGKSKERKQKILTKNQKLAEERTRRRLKQKTDQEKAAREGRENPAKGANSESIGGSAEDDRGAIHPSRMNRVGH